MRHLVKKTGFLLAAVMILMLQAVMSAAASDDNSLYDLGIKEAIAAFDGVVMGTSAGALIQLDEYHLNEEEGYPYQIQEGLGLIGGFDIDVHYEENETHVSGIIRSIEDMDRPVVCMPNDGGMILDGENVELLGGTFVLTRDNLDELYEEYDALQYGW